MLTAFLQNRRFYRFIQFYRTHPEIFSTPLRKSSGLLTWSHYLVLLRETRNDALAWYEKEALEPGWSVRTLDRNVSTLYYDRLLASQDQRPVIAEMKDKTAEYDATHHGKSIADEG